MQAENGCNVVAVMCETSAKLLPISKYGYTKQ